MKDAFFVLTPLGLPQANELAAALAVLQIVVVARESLSPWARAATSLYARREAADAQVRAAAFEARWRELCPEDRAERWWLRSPEDYARLIAHKASLRTRFPGVALGVAYAGWPPFRLHAFHVPDAGDMVAEAARLDGYCLVAGRR